jgi:HlyD family secretion protein
MTEPANRLSPLNDGNGILTESEPQTPRRSSPPRAGARPGGGRRKRGILGKLLLLVVAAAAVGGVLVSAGIVSIPSGLSERVFGKSNSANARYLLDTVALKPFRLTVRERGTVGSVKSVTLSNKVEGTTTIISIVPEGTQVKEGDLLVELDASVLVETEKTQVIAVTQADAALKKAEESLAIQQRQNESDIAAAQLALDLAILDKEKFEKGDFPQQKAELEGQVQVAREDLKRLNEVYEFNQRLAAKGFVSTNELDGARISAKKAEINLAAAVEKLKVLTD